MIPGSPLLHAASTIFSNTSRAESVAALDQRKRPVVAQRFCGGRSVEETAEVLKVSLETAMREWRVARRGFTLK
ncbi:MAG: ECF-type sigma factor [Acidobacteriota bacterium]